MKLYYIGDSHPDPLQLCLDIMAEATMIAVDIETVSLKDQTLLGVGITNSDRYGFYFMVGSEWWDKLSIALVVSSDRAKIFHNALYDMPILRKNGIMVDEPIEDTMLMARILDLPQRLQDLAATQGYYDVKTVEEILDGKEKMSDLPLAVVAEKCIRDVRATFGVYQKLRYKAQSLAYVIDRNIIPVLVKTQEPGIKVDHAERERLGEKLAKNVSWYKSICAGQGFNPSSPMQVGYALANRGNFLAFTKNKLKPKLSTAEAVLEALNDPLAQLVLLYRHDAKMLNTYIEPLEGQDRAYTHFHLDAITARISSTHRNMQNIPPELRSMFIPDEDVFTDIDFSQIELRVLAYLSQDSAMLEVFNQPDGTPEGDIHLATMKAFDVTDRRVAKKFNFAMVYGGQAPILSRICHIPIESAYKFRKLWFEKYKGAADWMDKVQSQAKKTHYVETLFGRRIYIKEFDYVDGLEEALRKAINYPNQAGAAELVKLGMYKCKRLPDRLQVHDELLFDGKVEIPDLSNLGGVKTPYKVKYTERWT